MEQSRKTPAYLQRVNFSSPDDILQQTLGEQFGARYQQYRNDYYHSLDARDHGQSPDFAHTLALEFVNRCNLTCGMCYIANHTFKKATLGLDQIKKLIDEAIQYGKTGLLLGVGSEGLLYRDIRKVIEYARSGGIMDILLMTNGTLVTEDFSKFVIEQQVSRVCISVDAATPETYEKVRGKDELEKLENNIRTLAETKKRLQSALPVIRLSFCVTEDNRHEQMAFREKWESVVDYLDYQKLADNSYVGREDESPVKELIADEDGTKPFCTKPFGYLNVWSNGDISPCCNFHGKSLVFGNIETDTLEDVYNGEKMAALREEMLSGEVNKTCLTCLHNRENLIDDAISR